MKIIKGDKVKVLAGKDRGREGKVLRVLPAAKKVVVEGVNLLVKHMRPRRMAEKGQRIQFPIPLPMSRVKLVCPKCGRPARVGYQILENKKKARICKKCRAIL